jgi:hypothetical protein
MMINDVCPMHEELFVRKGVVKKRAFMVRDVMMEIRKISEFGNFSNVTVMICQINTIEFSDLEFYKDGLRFVIMDGHLSLDLAGAMVNDSILVTVSDVIKALNSDDWKALPITGFFGEAKSSEEIDKKMRFKEQIVGMCKSCNRKNDCFRIY